MKEHGGKGRTLLVFLFVLLLCVASAQAQKTAQIPVNQESHGSQEGLAAQNDEELQRGIELTRQGRFREAIPVLLAARSHIPNRFAAEFNLALCYVATGQDPAAIQVLQSVLRGGHTTAPVYNLLAQAYVGVAEPERAWEAFQQSATLEPTNEKLYVFLSDACMDHGSYDLGLKVVSLGLEHLPKSARLHYERAIFLSFLDEPDEARKELQLAAELAPGSTISSLAMAQKGLLDGNMPQAIDAARKGLRKEPENYILLTILGQALIRNGAGPGQPEFDEARKSLEQSVAGHPDYSVSQLALGQLMVLARNVNEAIPHLEKAKQLAPDNPSAYSQLAAAYRQQGSLKESEAMLAKLASLNTAQAGKYKLDPPDHKGSYIGSAKP